MGFIKKVFLLVGAAAVVVIGIRLQQSRNKAIESQAPPAVTAPAQGQGQSQGTSPMLAPPMPFPPAPPTHQLVQVAKNLATSDPMQKRKLDLPLPKGKRDLLASLTDLKAPMLPGLNTEDSDIKAVFRGFYEAEPGKFRRIEFTRAQAMSLSIEDVNQRFPVYQEAKGDFDVSNYNDDPYSIVMTLRDMRVVYLKFYTGRKIPDYTDPTFRVMLGWIMDGKGARVARRLAMIDGRKPELADARVAGEFLWPRLEVIQMLMPTSGLGD